MSKLFKLAAIVGVGVVAALPAITQLPEKTASAGDKSNIEGNFAIKGEGDDGEKYTGAGTISLIGGNMYNAKWTIGSNTFTGVCFRDDDDLSCGWATKAKDANVVAYLVKPDGLDGVWFETGGTKLGTEYLKPKGSAKKNLDGNYNISIGKNPDGSAYSGSVVVKQMADIGEAVYKFQWTIGGNKQDGIGVRNIDAGEDDVISVGFADSGKEFGALQYDISSNGKTLTGHWVQSIDGKVSDGKETMTKK